MVSVQWYIAFTMYSFLFSSQWALLPNLTYKLHHLHAEYHFFQVLLSFHFPNSQNESKAWNLWDPCLWDTVHKPVPMKYTEAGGL